MRLAIFLFRFQFVCFLIFLCSLLSRSSYWFSALVWDKKVTKLFLRHECECDLDNMTSFSKSHRWKFSECLSPDPLRISCTTTKLHKFHVCDAEEQKQAVVPLMCHPVSDNLPEKTPIRVLEVCDEIATKIAEIDEIATYFYLPLREHIDHYV